MRLFSIKIMLLVQYYVFQCRFLDILSYREIRNFLTFNLGPGSISSRGSGSFGRGQVYDKVWQYWLGHDFGERPFAQKLCKLPIGEGKLHARWQRA